MAASSTLYSAPWCSSNRLTAVPVPAKSNQLSKKFGAALFYGNSLESTPPRLTGLVPRAISESNSAEQVAAVAGDNDEDIIQRLQNGTDVRGVALEGEKGRRVDLTPPVAEAIGECFGEWLKERLRREGWPEKAKVRVSVARDPRISGPKLSTAVFAGLVSAGCVVFDMGLATTPACFMSTVLPPFAYDASIMVREIQLNSR